ncbi:hypothetical protein Enr10x_23940 [Gimesia panareensis]|uniref:Uncharacterized protein n=1 Tax=Gimesia panareensis TaxID=2527978 RepID=A0A517Q610_9PLAN|nr:hypothetical protein [Gimesia panareensis]QDT27080.1 hypothetical protein Enr10x_23940 [Gimesia panareensis]
MKYRLFSNGLRVHSVSLPVLFCLTSAVLCSGCGSETYEKRLNETAQYFAYLDVRNQALSGAWSSPTIHFRPPLDFQEIRADLPAAAPKEENADTDTEAAPAQPDQSIDPRQPDYIDLKLPGLEGAWRTEVPVDLENETVDRPAYLYVLSNYSLLKAKEKEAAANFFSDVNNQLSTTFGQFLNTEDFVTERFPHGKGYINPKSFTYGVLTPEMPIDGVPYEVQIYLSEANDNQAVILVVLPKEMAHKSKLQKQIEYSLETFELQSPQGGGDGGTRESTQF